MKKIFKSRIFIFMLGILVSGISAYAITIVGKDVSYDNTNSGLTSTNVQGAVDELNEKISNISTDGYIARFEASDLNMNIVSKEVAVPNVYYNSDYGYLDGNNKLVITKPGNYLIIGSAAHTYIGCTTFAHVTYDGTTRSLSSSDLNAQNIFPIYLTINEPKTLEFTYTSNCCANNSTRSSAIILIIRR